VPLEAVEAGRQLIKAGGLDLGAVEYLETTDGRRVFYDINANSNLRPAVAWEFGFDPFERVTDFLIAAIEDPRHIAGNLSTYEQDGVCVS